MIPYQKIHFYVYIGFYFLVEYFTRGSAFKEQKPKEKDDGGGGGGGGGEK